MPTDLDDLLPGAAGDPSEPIDVDELWARGRRRRRWRHASAVTGGLASVALLAVAITSIDLGGTATPEVAPMSSGDAADETGEAGETGDADVADAEDSDEIEAEDQAEDQVDAEGSSGDVEDARDEEAAAEDLEAQGNEDADTDTGPTPDAAALEDPCGAFEDRRGEAFVEVVGPVDGQVVDDAIELVGCASVYEGTVRYRLLDGDEVLVDSFTTATYGGPELGEFTETIPVEASGTLTLQVFWDSPADGTEQGLVEVGVEAR